MKMRDWKKNRIQHFSLLLVSSIQYTVVRCAAMKSFYSHFLMWGIIFFVQIATHIKPHTSCLCREHSGFCSMIHRMLCNMFTSFLFFHINMNYSILLFLTPIFVHKSTYLVSKRWMFEIVKSPKLNEKNRVFDGGQPFWWDINLIGQYYFSQLQVFTSWIPVPYENSFPSFKTFPLSLMFAIRISSVSAYFLETGHGRLLNFEYIFKTLMKSSILNSISHKRQIQMQNIRK